MLNIHTAVMMGVSILVLVLSPPVQAKKTYKQPLLTQNPPTHYWFNGKHKQALWHSADEVVIHTASGKARSHHNPSQITTKYPDEIQVLHRNSSWAHLKLNTRTVIRDQHPLLANLALDSGQPLASVYYTNSHRHTGLHIATSDMLVHFHDALTLKQARQWGFSHNLTMIRPLNLDHAYLFHCHKQTSCLQQANRVYHEPPVKYAYPNWIRPKTPRHTGSFSANDTLFDQQWYLDNQGQTQGVVGADLNLLPAWRLGHGSPREVIAIVDEGVEITHEDLQDNIIPELSWDFIDNDNDPKPTTQETHGTQVAGVAAAHGGNSLGVTGVAPHVGLVSLRFIGGGESFTNEAAILTHRYDAIDIYNNSWGPTDDVHLEGLVPLTEAGLIDGTSRGRNGKGAIYVWAAGNGQSINDNSNYDGYANSPYTIAVTASTHTGILAPYSEKGANLWVNVPSSGSGAKITTTDLESSSGISGNYTRNFGGTSAAAPQVSGVVALMLEQNAQLGWRDVQKILAKTADQNDPDDDSWAVNGAGYPVSHKYGFGRVNAAQAVITSAHWNPAPPQLTASASIDSPIIIPDNSESGVQSKITLNENFNIEYVEVTFTSDHSFWGDLDIILTSPSGTQSILAEHNPLGQGAAYQTGWRFGSARLLDEQSQGQWTLTVKDRSAIDTGQINHWAIKIYGTPISSPSSIEFGTVLLDHNWKTIQLKSRYIDPVVIVSPPTFNGNQPVVIRLRAVSNKQFQLRLQEWRYLDGHHLTESVAYLVMEKGRHQQANGSIWEAGTLTQSGTGQWLPLQLPPSSKLFLSVQSFKGQQALTPRARTPLLADNDFATALFEEEALMDGHKAESVGYLAITEAGKGQSQVVINGTLTPYLLTTASFTDKWTPANNHWQLKLEEETSADLETRHIPETIALLSLNAHLFAQDISSRGRDTLGIRIHPIAP